MPHRLTRKQKSRALKTARKWVNIKLKLESPFKTELRRYFAIQNRRIATGLEIETIAPVLDHHYKRIVRKITGIKLKQDDKETEDRILIILFGRATFQASKIDSTTNKFIRRSVELARQELSEIGQDLPSATTINRITANIMRGFNGNRVGGIAVSETQMLTEKIRDELTDIAAEMMNIAIFEENQALAQEAADLADSATFEQIADDIGKIPMGDLFVAAKLLEKTWVTMGDKKVRPTHNAANFQTVLITEPFIVGGTLLMYPGDTSLGAPIREIANCRCVKVNM